MTVKATAIKLKRQSRILEVQFDNDEQHQLSCEFLRVHSPSAEVHQHGNPILVTHKKMVNIDKIEPVGHYAVKLVFDDGHDSGIYSWELLLDMGRNQADMWQAYLARLRAEKGSREPLIDIVAKYTP
ncbi:gamma-butyrobetaine hydroxylase-like domain-containing protein [Paraferrimonas sedimenticola]|uniref:Gamma-butyrobetaine hydroxylase-like N-terminal domain-containing protein n=1 Tax=Paraferrimonas sedimenticola TaxID=375674 RepID=A0AA37RXS6_9GAMM|nr:gamma-butyrobetaine hydroxylase-like domain-containing protein [Paraferrimonas sedimenticola]GLP97431.1 hypothetical protein GCM10007895_27380 [Paraferrimonas sedimenticola]